MNGRCLPAFAALTIALGLASCSSSESDNEDSQDNVNQTDSGSNNGSDAGQCPVVAARCPSGCAGIDGFILDEQDQCLSRRVRLGCRAEDAGGTTDIACIREVSTGWLYQLESGSDATALAASDEFDACSDEERQTALDATECSVIQPSDGGACPNDRNSCPAGCTAFQAREFNQAGSCLEPSTQLGCYPEGVILSPDGSCAKEIATDKVWLLESGSFSDDLLFSGEFKACGLDDVAASSTSLADCP